MPHLFSISVMDPICQLYDSFINVRLLGEMPNQIEQMLILVFENYKSLDESLPSQMANVFGPATGVAAPALASALELYKLLHDILSPENAARKRSKRHLLEIGKFVSRSNENILSDSGTVAQAYKKIKSLCLNIRNQILCNIEIQKNNLLPRWGRMMMGPKEQVAFMMEIESFYKLKTIDFKPPKFYGQPLNCLKLWTEIIRLRGYDRRHLLFHGIL